MRIGKNIPSWWRWGKFWEAERRAEKPSSNILCPVDIPTPLIKATTKFHFKAGVLKVEEGNIIVFPKTCWLWLYGFIHISYWTFSILLIFRLHFTLTFKFFVLRLLVIWLLASVCLCFLLFFLWKITYAHNLLFSLKNNICAKCSKKLLKLDINKKKLLLKI